MSLSTPLTTNPPNEGNGMGGLGSTFRLTWVARVFCGDFRSGFKGKAAICWGPLKKKLAQPE